MQIDTILKSFPTQKNTTLDTFTIEISQIFMEEPIPICKLFKRTLVLNLRSQNTKVLKENTEEILQDTVRGSKFSDKIPEALAIKEKKKKK